MTQRIKALYENGVLRPLQPLQGVPDHSRVDITVSTPDTLDARHGPGGLEACLGTLPAADADEMSRIIEAEFEKVDERDW